MVISHLPVPDAGARLGMPPLVAQLWLLLALVPVAALFSAVCIALAAFARSTKEGQYYLMPLLLVTLPLVILPMGPGMELNLGNSLIPLTGLVLLLRNAARRKLSDRAAIRRTGGDYDFALLPNGGSLGGRAIQQGKRSVPRKRTARCRPMAEALGARSRRHAQRDRGYFLRCLDSDDSVLHGLCGAPAAIVRRFRAQVVVTQLVMIVTPAC